MLARLALAAALFALAAPAAPTQPPKKKDKPAAKIDPAKVAAAEKALAAMKCVLTAERDRTKKTAGMTTQVTFPDTATDADFAKALPHLQILPALTAVDIGGTKITDEGAAQLAKLTKLDSLFLDGLPITTKTLEAIAGLPELRWLVLAERNGKGLAAGKEEIALLGKLTRLQHLTVAFAAGVKADDLEPFQSLSGLSDLTVFGGGSAGLEGLKHITSSRRLSQLSLGYGTSGTFTVGDEEAKVLGEATSLTTLYFPPGGTAKPLTDVGVKALSNLRGLTSLSLYGQKITLGKDTNFGQMTGLKTLSVYGAVGDEGLAEIGKLTELTTLTLSLFGTPSFTGTADLSKLKKLTYVTVSGAITDDGLKSIATLPAVQTLYLNSLTVSNDGLKVIPKMKTLTTLTLGGRGYAAAKAATKTPDATGITGDGLANLAGSGITMLTVNAEIDGSDLKALAGCKALTYLNVNTTATDDAAIKAVMAAKTLRQIHAVGTKVTKVGKAAVEKALPGSVVYIEYERPQAMPVGPVIRTPTVRTTGGNSRP